MIICPPLVQNSIARWKRSKANAGELARRIGEHDRTAVTTSEQRERRYAALLAQTRNAEAAHAQLERMLGGNDLVGINYLELGSFVARSVCRIHLQDRNRSTIGFGTGFLVAPGVLMTNHHVIGNAEEARYALAEFDYEYDVRNVDRAVTTFQILADPAPIAVQALDFCLVSVASQSIDHQRSLSDYGWLALSSEPGKAFVGEYLTIIQHPKGERKQVCVRENKLLKYDPSGNSIWYMTDTVPGSSGSPVFNNSWQVVALHHSGVPKTDAQGRWLTVDGKVWDPSMDESRVQWEANEGIRISRILEYLKATSSGHPIGSAVLRSADAPQQTPPPILRESSAGPQARMQNGELQVTIPIQIGVRVGSLLNAPAGAAAAVTNFAPATAASTPDALVTIPAGVEKVVIDQTNYDKRPGYNPEFLGEGSLRVPLPTVNAAADVLEWTDKGKKKTELKYWNYSVVLSKRRKLAYFSAVNVDANMRPGDAGRDGDAWFYDTRPKDFEDCQIGPEFYAKQKTFEMDRSQNPFDRGHLTRRLDAQWGKDERESTRNGNDSFHWSNCSPQHWRYNQGSKKWLGLEDYVIKTFAGRTGRACVINGPVFDAPLSKQGADGRPLPNISGKRHADPTFGGVSIPKLFFKVVACEGADDQLAVAAFLMSQEDLLAAEDRVVGLDADPDEILTEKEARLFQVSLADLAKITKLDFGTLADADTKDMEEALAVPRELKSIEDFRVGT